MTDTDNQAAHAAKFAQVSKNLKRLADQLVAEHPDFPRQDFGRAYLVTAIALLLDGVGPVATGRYLHALAAAYDAGEPPPTVMPEVGHA
jgi:hypothetical protein